MLGIIGSLRCSSSSFSSLSDDPLVTAAAVTLFLPVAFPDAKKNNQIDYRLSSSSLNIIGKERK